MNKGLVKAMATNNDFEKRRTLQVISMAGKDAKE
jgi:hypothetical protein